MVQEHRHFAPPLSSTLFLSQTQAPPFSSYSHHSFATASVVVEEEEEGMIFSPPSAAARGAKRVDMWTAGGADF